MLVVSGHLEFSLLGIFPRCINDLCAIQHPHRVCFGFFAHDCLPLFSILALSVSYSLDSLSSLCRSATSPSDRRESVKGRATGESVNYQLTEQSFRSRKQVGPAVQIHCFKTNCSITDAVNPVRKAIALKFCFEPFRSAQTCPACQGLPLWGSCHRR